MARKIHDVSFHVKDQAGRQVGCKVYLSDDLRACVQQTRDGKPFGATQMGQTFATLDERTAYVKKTIDARRKAAYRKYAA